MVLIFFWLIDSYPSNACCFAFVCVCVCVSLSLSLSLVDRPGAFYRWWRGGIFGEWVSMPHICNRCGASRRASHCQACRWWNEVGVELGRARPIVSLRYGRYSGTSARLQNGTRQQGFYTFCKHTLKKLVYSISKYIRTQFTTTKNWWKN